MRVATSGDGDMAMTLEELEKRVVALEQEVALLKQQRNGATDDALFGMASSFAVLDQEKFRNGFAKALAAMGITGSPIGAHRLQEMLIAEGIRPQDNEFSRAIIEMREE